VLQGSRIALQQQLSYMTMQQSKRCQTRLDVRQNKRLHFLKLIC
jgi:hypothetical protein